MEIPERSHSIGCFSQMLVVKPHAAVGIMFPYAFIPQCIQLTKLNFIWERYYKPGLILSWVRVTSDAMSLRLHWHKHIFHTQLLLLLMSLFWSDGQDKRLSVWAGMDKMSKVPPCPWSADVSWLTRRVCVGSVCKVPVFWQKGHLQDIFF